MQELRPLVRRLQTSYDNVQLELSSMKTEMDELRLQMQRVLLSLGDDHQSEETISLEELNHQQVSFP